MSATLRAASADDRDAMIALWIEAWTPVFPDIDFAARATWFGDHIDTLTAKGARVTVAQDAAGLSGFSIFDPATGDMDQLCVALRAQGSPVARDLLDALKRANPRVTLAVNRDNPRARRFYAREGFRIVGEGVSERSGLPLVFMEWRAG